MKLVIFGATGGTGRELLLQAIAAGHQVTAVTRDPGQIGGSHANLRVVQGNLLDAPSVWRAIEGQDAVLCAAGSGSFETARKPTTIYSVGTRLILRGMVQYWVQRLITVTSVGTQDLPNEPLIYRLFIKPLLKETYLDMGRMEREIVLSPLAWTVVRPPELLDGPRTGHYREGVDQMPPGGIQLRRADLAAFMLKQLTSDTYVRKFVAVAY